MGNTLAPQRKGWLDALRGLAILLVVLVHCLPSGNVKYIYTVFTGPIKLPLFFAISGYVFNLRDGHQGKFFLNIFRKILLPSVIIFASRRLLYVLDPDLGFWGGIDYLKTGLSEFFSGEICWYISACILAEILFFYILKFCNKQWLICMVAMLCCVAGFVMDAFGFGDFAMFNRAFIAQAFLLMGYMFRKYEDFFRKLHWSILAGCFLVVAVMIGLTFWLWPNRAIDVHMNNYYGSYETIPYCFLLIGLSTLGLMTLGTKLGRISKVLAFYGKHTLFTYINHGFFLSIGMRLLPLGNSTGIVLLLKCVALSLFSVTVCSLISMLINRFLPELMGRPRKKKEKKQPANGTT